MTPSTSLAAEPSVVCDWLRAMWQRWVASSCVVPKRFVKEKFTCIFNFSHFQFSFLPTSDTKIYVGSRKAADTPHCAGRLESLEVADVVAERLGQRRKDEASPGRCCFLDNNKLMPRLYLTRASSDLLIEFPAGLQFVSRFFPQTLRTSQPVCRKINAENVDRQLQTFMHLKFEAR